MKNSRFSSFVGWGNSISNRFVFVGKLELLTKFVGALLFVIALAGNVIGQSYSISNDNGLSFPDGKNMTYCDKKDLYSIKIKCDGNETWRSFRLNTPSGSLNHPILSGNLDFYRTWDGDDYTKIYFTSPGTYYLIYDINTNTITTENKFVCDESAPPTIENYSLRDLHNIECINGNAFEFCNGKYKLYIKVTTSDAAQWANNFHIYLGEKQYDDVVNQSNIGHDPYNNRQYYFTGGYTKNEPFWLVIEDDKLSMQSTEPNCGLVVPEIYSGNSTVCKESIISDLLYLSGAKSEGWEYTDGSEVDFTNLIIGKSIQYFAVDDKNVKSTSNTVKIIDKPSISDIDPIAFCSDDGAYNLQNLLDKVQNNEGSNPSTAITFNGSSVSGNYTFSNAGTLKIASTNGCSNGTPTTKDIPVTIGCTPHVTLSNSDNIETCNGNSIVLPNVTVDDGSTAQWKIKKSGSSTWTDFDASKVLDMSYNGATLRAEATNAQGTGKSTEITLTVNSDAPGFTYTKSPNQTTLSQSLGGTPASVTYTLKKDNECNSDPISISINNSSDFEISDNTVKLKSGKGVGTYTTTVTFTQAGETKTEDITVSVVEWPKTYIIKKSTDGGNTWVDYELTTDNSGNINWTLNSGESAIYQNEGTISCTNFTISTTSDNYSNCKFINKGTIVASGTINIGTSSNKVGGGIDFYCEGIWKASNFNTNYRNATPTLNGTFVIENDFYVAIAQGQDLSISNCTELYAKNAEINVTGGEMKLYINGHVVAEVFTMNNNVIVQKGAIMTIGEEEISKSFTAQDGSILNLCYNPTPNADNISKCDGCTIFYNYGERGWENGNNPLIEGDVTGTVSDKGLQQVYSSYEDCIEEKNLSTLLGMDDDPFLPKQKEIKHLYNYNPCDDETLYKFQYGPEIYRIFEQHFIRCEKDNKR